MVNADATRKSCTVNPLKLSQPIGAALAFMGIDRCMPLLHGSQGCTSFGLVLLVRHFREAIPLQTTAMSEVATVLGGFENLEQAVLTIASRAAPAMIGICSTGVTEIKGDDIEGFIRLIRTRHPELANLAIVPVATPDFQDAFQDGWAKAVTAMVTHLVPAQTLYTPRRPDQINILPGSHLTPGDIEELKALVAEFGLEPVVLPDLSGSLDGHMPTDFTPTTIGGTTIAQISSMGDSVHTLAIGEQTRTAAEALQSKTGIPFDLFDRLTGLAPNDAFLAALSRISGKPVPPSLRRQRSQLLDAMLDGHFFFGGKRVAIAAEPDLLFAMSIWLTEMGCTIPAAITTTESPLLGRIPAATTMIGDLEDVEQHAANCDLLIAPSHGRQAAERLNTPLFRLGMPVFDRLGAGHRVSVGYRGTRNLIFDIGNIFAAATDAAHCPQLTRISAHTNLEAA
jgi:nitrogenase molybdenum-iron protein NifN